MFACVNVCFRSVQKFSLANFASPITSEKHTRLCTEASAPSFYIPPQCHSQSVHYKTAVRAPADVITAVMSYRIDPPVCDIIISCVYVCSLDPVVSVHRTLANVVIVVTLLLAHHPSASASDTDDSGSFQPLIFLAVSAELSC